MDHRVKKKKKRKKEIQKKVFGPCQRAKIATEHIGGDDTIYSCYARNDPQKLGKGTGRRRNQRISRDHPDFSICIIGQNIEKSPRDVGRLAVSERPLVNAEVKNSQGL